MPNNKITDEYGVQLPIHAVFDYIELMYGEAVHDDMKRVYDDASRRYSRAAQLKQFKRIIESTKRNGGRFGRPAALVLAESKFKRYQYAVDHAQQYIDGDISLTSLAE